MQLNSQFMRRISSYVCSPVCALRKRKALVGIAQHWNLSIACRTLVEISPHNLSVVCRRRPSHLEAPLFRPRFFSIVINGSDMGRKRTATGELQRANSDPIASAGEANADVDEAEDGSTESKSRQKSKAAEAKKPKLARAASAESGATPSIASKSAVLAAARPRPEGAVCTVLSIFVKRSTFLLLFASYSSALASNGFLQREWFPSFL